jgi:hypothetical protein
VALTLTARAAMETGVGVLTDAGRVAARLAESVGQAAETGSRHTIHMLSSW